MLHALEISNATFESVMEVVVVVLLGVLARLGVTITGRAVGEMKDHADEHAWRLKERLDAQDVKIAELESKVDAVPSNVANELSSG